MDRRKAVWAVAIAVFVLSFVLRLLEFTFHNDHYEFLALGEEILRGAIPGIDFFDSARPLQHYLSTVGLWLFGHQMLAEALICIALLSFGAVVVFFLGLELTGAISLGLLAATFVVAMLPRLYGYPKIIAPALGLVALWRYVDRPSPWRLAATAAMTAVAFYLRFDHGVAVGAAVGVALIARHWREWRPLAVAMLQYGLVVLLLCGPWVIFQSTMGGSLSSGPGSGRLKYLLQGEDVVTLGVPRVPSERPLVWFRPAGPLATVGWNPTVSDEQRSALEQRYALRRVKLVNDHAWQYVLLDRSPATLTRLLADPSVAGVTNVDSRGQILREPPWDVLRRWLHVPVIESPFLNEQNAAIWLYDVMFFTPLVAAAILAVRTARRRSVAGEAPKVLAVIVLGVLFNVLLIRGNLDSHLPDVIVPAALLWSWMLRGTWRARSPVRFASAALALLSVWMAVDVYAGSVNYLTATELFSTPRNVARRLVGTIRGLRADPLEQFAPPGSQGLRALTRYVDRCTKATDHLLVLGYQPEMYFTANRRIAGGNVSYQANLGATPAQQAVIVSRLQRQSVPVVIQPVNTMKEVEQTYPILKRYIDERYVLAQESGFGEGRLFRVLVDRQAVPSHLDQELGLPCFRP
jgi:hypothetical protein